ncbi:MAG: 2-C-methyl-D-erythritol 2,4-cyclodiphosphate synthase [Sumerlaeia bacterium]
MSNPPPFRIGVGYDVHRFAQNRKCIIGGVEIPHHQGLLGHSDADVLTHAIMDALLGAAGLPDIGFYFPPSDAKWAGARSVNLLEQVCQEIQKAGYAIGNIDCSLIAEKPKIGPHINAMKAQIAQACGLQVSQIGIKATSNEGMGFVGREEGIAAHAVALLFALNTP